MIRINLTASGLPDAVGFYCFCFHFIISLSSIILGVFMFYFSFSDAVSSGKRIYSKEGHFAVLVYRSAYSTLYLLFRDKPSHACFYYFYRIRPYHWVCDPFFDPSS